MNTLRDHKIIYDDECPMCAVYTKAFVDVGMLEADGRIPYTEIRGTTVSGIDWERARNQIALVNTRTNKVTYGLDSLTTIIGHSLPLLKPVFNSRLFHSLISHLYMFVSYNRKVIAPAPVFEGENKCTPDLNYPYRWSYIIFSWLVTSVILARYASLLVPLVPASCFWREFAICGGQLVFQGVVVMVVNKERLIHYLGNMMTVSLAGAILLTPALIVGKWFGEPVVFAVYFLVVVLLMLAEHMRRAKILGMTFLVSVTWVVYRLAVLAAILILSL